MLLKALLKDIEAGNLKSFGPHYQGRQILIDAVVHDLVENYNALNFHSFLFFLSLIIYLSKTQYNIIGSAFVRCLRLPSTPENLAIWKDALQTKLKRTRADHPNSNLVQVFRSKYSNLGSGRPVKQKNGTIVERDRNKQMVIMPYSEELSDEIQSKVVQLQNFSQLDVSTQLRLWKETFIFRRQIVRDQSTSDIMKNFPAYSNAFLEPPTPYPTLVSIDDVIHIYVDFNPIVSTSSPDDALGLLIAMYSIFELSFDKKSRTIRFLYCVLHGCKQFISTSIRVLIKDKNIDIHRERLQLPSISSYSVSNDTTALTNESQSQSQIITTLLDHSVDKHNSFVINQTTESTTSTDSSHSNVYSMTSDANECNAKNVNVSPSDCNSPLQAEKKRKRKQNLNEEENDDILMKNAPQENVDSSLSRPPLASMTNSTVAIRQTKRKRRI
ncbi:unnamed protein product [Rotaria magnacalcarata]|uniref:Uncharacterized protein n=2 Tax=Rotaria magnacalcarata TaxID=392030 RepID=A0A816M2F2_9BILA|nr:unnamed protein product [Rotaria magnacalcarata]